MSNYRSIRMAGPLRVVLLSVVVFCFLGTNSTNVFGENLLLAINADRIYQMEGAALRNVRLELRIHYSEETECALCPINHPDWRFALPYWDHIVYQNLDDPNDTGVAVPLRCTQPNGEDYGDYYYDEALIWCDPLEGVPGYCERSLWSYSWNIYGHVLLTLPWCGNYRIYYVMDRREWTLFCNGTMEDSLANPDIRTIMMEATGVISGRCAGIDSNLVAYITSDPHLEYETFDINMGECPDHPPLGEPTCEFTGYIDSEGEDGREWLPTPGDSIGLVFEMVTDPPNTEYDVAYHIWDLSMWKGECMNSPRYDTCTALDSFDVDPHTLGFAGQVPSDSLWKFRFHDFTLGEPERYTIYVWDTLAINRIYPYKAKQIDPVQLVSNRTTRAENMPDTLKLFRTQLVAYHRTDARFDTLWLKARDYAAHCLVTPQVGGGKDRRMLPWLSPNGEELYTITVPYDYDGPTDVGINFGDGMADAWEDSIGAGDIHRFHPFREEWPSQRTADNDSLPTGRRIDGDYFCNFAEYRGLMIVEDSAKVHSQHIHRRLDPMRKTVLAHVRHNMGDDPDNAAVLALMPGYIYKLQLPSMLYPDTAEIYFTDSIRFRNEKPSPLDNEEIERFRARLVGRDINFNSQGAFRWYQGLIEPTLKPMEGDLVIRAVTFWPWFSDFETHAIEADPLSSKSILGKTYTLQVFGTRKDGGGIPRLTKRILVNIDRYNEIRERYYAGHEHAWQEDFSRKCSQTIAHEFGHAIGMEHLSYSDTLLTIMSPCAIVDSVDTTVRFILADSVYSDTSKAQFSIKGQ